MHDGLATVASSSDGIVLPMALRRASNLKRHGGVTANPSHRETLTSFCRGG